MKQLGIRKLGAFALALGLSSATLAGCSSQDDGQNAISTRHVGSIGFKLTLPGGVTLNSVDYTISGPNAFSKTGSIPLGGNGITFSAKIDGLPSGKGYTIKLNASEASGSTMCMGSASFDVVANATTAVSVKLSCPGMKGSGGNADGVGSVVINGVINFCPVVQSATATPAGDGKTYNLIGLGTDSDGMPSPLSYKWTANNGATLSGTNAANVTLTCPAAGGSVSVVFEVLDGTPEDGGCGDKITLSSIDCTPCTSNCGGGAAGTTSIAGSGAAGTTSAAGTGASGTTSAAGTGAAGTTSAAGTGAAGTTSAAGTGAAGGGAAGTTSAAGTGAAGSGAAGTTSAAGTGAAGSGTAGTGAAGSTSSGSCTAGDACCECERQEPKMLDGMVNLNCRDSLFRCENFEGVTSAMSTMPGMPKKDVCKAVVKCMHDTKCAKDAPSDCLCGPGVDPFDCFTASSSASYTGACKAIIIAGAESDKPADLQTAFFDPTNPSGAADTVIETCDAFFCAAQCLQ